MRGSPPQSVAGQPTARTLHRRAWNPIATRVAGVVAARYIRRRRRPPARTPARRHDRRRLAARARSMNEHRQQGATYCDARRHFAANKFRRGSYAATAASSRTPLGVQQAKAEQTVAMIANKKKCSHQKIFINVAA